MLISYLVSHQKKPLATLFSSAPLNYSAASCGVSTALWWRYAHSSPPNVSIGGPARVSP